MQRTVYAVRILLFFFAVAFGCGLVLCKFYDLQIRRHEELLAKAKRHYTTVVCQAGRRGRILDCHGNLLAADLQCKDVHVEPPKAVHSLDIVAGVIAEATGAAAAELRRRILAADRRGRKDIPLLRRVSLRAARQIEAARLPGVRLVDSWKRYYPKGRLLSHVLGFVNHEGRGCAGIEQLFDARLQPRSGREVIERDRKGRWIEPNAVHLEALPRNGVDVYLTVDETIQHIVEEELERLVEEFQPKTAYAVMVNPRTGAVLAMAQKPDFDPNGIRRKDASFLQNRIVLTGFEPGSVMKGIAIAGALDYGVVTLDTRFDCENGCWYYAGKPLRDSGHRYGVLTVREIIQKSSNIGAAKIALEMGPERLYQTLRRFGFGRPTNIGLPGEASGIFRPLSHWDGLSITRFPIGQGILVTPLQLVQAYSAIANDGVMMQLRIISRIVDPATGLAEVYAPHAKCRAIRPETARTITEALKLVTKEGGTAPKAAVEGYETAGKTGTAQKVIDGHYSHAKFVASFVGFVPADAPAFVLLVAADEPSRGGHYGGTVAAPTFSRIATRTLRYLEIAPMRPELPVPPPPDDYDAKQLSQAAPSVP